MNRILVVDNYDSFTFNLVHILEAIANEDVDVFRNDDIELTQLAKYDYVVFSPGPGLPKESMNLVVLISEAIKQKKKVLGVCLGHQALAEATGGNLKNLEEVHHGVSHSIIVETKEPLFKGLPDTFKVGRYHSWVVDEDRLPGQWQVTCRDQEGEIMGMQHRELPVFGIQFHPESILSPEGKTILKNFLEV
ncbi:aminodeoxychorismate/anthranilate synthase component II [Cryomorphaceae bacterium 1068]|nr:aminodeoxychorismate/anthranilate synthase component II [Cryomorphaceae bacterium 1068]